MTNTQQPDPVSGSEFELRQLLESDPPADEVSDRVALQKVESVAVVTLSHPEAHNTLALASWQRLRSVFDALANDPNLRAVVVRGAGTKAFAAGADINELPQNRMTAAAATNYNECIADALRSVGAIPVPVIASVRGLAVGGGCELSTACDIRIVTADAKFGIPIGKLGVILGYAEADTTARLIGPAALKYLLFSGELIKAEEAFRLGLVQKIVLPDELAASTAKLVGQICNQSDITMRASKLISDMHGRTLTAADTELLSRLSVEAYEGDDLKEGVAAFAEGRRSVFSRQKGN